MSEYREIATPSRTKEILLKHIGKPRTYKTPLPRTPFQ